MKPAPELAPLAERLAPYARASFARAAALAGWPRDEVVDLAAVYQKLLAEKQLAGYAMHQRFYEIGSHAGLNELDELLRGSQPPAPNIHPKT